MRQKLSLAIAGVGSFVGAAIALATGAHASFDYTNTFAPLQSELETAITAVMPYVIGVFVIVLAISLALRLGKKSTKA